MNQRVIKKPPSLIKLTPHLGRTISRIFILVYTGLYNGKSVYWNEIWVHDLKLKRYFCCCSTEGCGTVHVRLCGTNSQTAETATPRPSLFEMAKTIWLPGANIFASDPYFKVFLYTISTWTQEKKVPLQPVCEQN